MGVKRPHPDMEGSEAAPASQSPFTPMFEQFRAELDEHHDRRERIIKASRDITAASKKIIFALQRIRDLNKPIPAHVLKASKPHYEVISNAFASVSRDLQAPNSHRYARQISGGCQEYIEAATFQYYLESARLLSYEEARDNMRKLDASGPGVELSVEDYILGVYDMTGELMKFSITAMATSGELPMVVTSEEGAGVRRGVLTDMRALRAELEGFDGKGGPFAAEAGKKMSVMQTSVEKVEKALYGLIVRGAERPKGWMPDVSDGPGRSVEVEG